MRFLLAEIAWFQSILSAVGWFLSKLYDLVGNYGLAIILLTVIVRILLYPLGVKQIHGMYAMQKMQPKVKAIQAKYKGNKQKAQEETMKLYQEQGVNPLGSCLPMVAQLPVLIILLAVLRPVVPGSTQHIPEDSALGQAIAAHETNFLSMNLACSATQAGDPKAPIIARFKTAAAIDANQTSVPVEDTFTPPTVPFTMTVGKEEMQVIRTADPPPGGTAQIFTVTRGMNNTVSEPHDAGTLSTTQVGTQDCGFGIPARIPYYALIGLMAFTSYYQARQMRKALPAQAQQGQQQKMMQYMPLMFSVIFISFPAGLVLYWTTTNAWQIGQQYFLLKREKAAEAAMPAEKVSKGGTSTKTGSGGQRSKAGPAKSETPKGGSSKKPAQPAKPAKKGFMQKMLEQAEQERARKLKEQGGSGRPKPGKKPGGTDDSGGNSGSG